MLLFKMDQFSNSSESVVCCKEIPKPDFPALPEVIEEIGVAFSNVISNEFSCTSMQDIAVKVCTPVVCF